MLAEWQKAGTMMTSQANIVRPFTTTEALHNAALPLELHPLPFLAALSKNSAFTVLNHCVKEKSIQHQAIIFSICLA